MKLFLIAAFVITSFSSVAFSQDLDKRSIQREIDELRTQKMRLEKKTLDVLVKNNLHDHEDIDNAYQSYVEVYKEYKDLMKKHPDLKQYHGKLAAARKKLNAAEEFTGENANSFYREASREVSAAKLKLEQEARVIPEIAMLQDASEEATEKRAKVEKMVLSTVEEGKKLVDEINVLDTKLKKLREQL